MIKFGFFKEEWVRATNIKVRRDNIERDEILIEYLDGTKEWYEESAFQFDQDSPIWNLRKAYQFGTPMRANRMKGFPCLICARTPSENAHVISRAADNDPKNSYRKIVPLCHRCHLQQHTVGIQTFQQMHQIDLLDEAKRVAEKLDKTHPTFL